MSLGARLRRYFALITGLGLGLTLISCGSTKPKDPPSGILTRVIASQSVTSASSIGGLLIINGWTDVLAKTRPIAAGNAPGLMTVSPSLNILMAFDSSSNSVYSVNTLTEQDIGTVALPGPTSSMVVPTSNTIGYAAVPTAQVNGYSFVGGIDVMNLAGSIATTIAVPNAQTVVSNPGGTQLLVFSPDSDSVAVINPSVAIPPVDTSCLSAVTTANATCTIVSGFNRPVYAVISGNTAYVMNCGLECGGASAASVAVFNLNSLTITNTIPVDAATWAFLSGSTLYVAGTSPTNNACTGEVTAATTCGRLDLINVNTGAVTTSFVITDGYHDRMDMSENGQLFVGSYNCTNIGDVDNPNGQEVRGCLSILNTMNNTVIIPPDNGDVTGLQGFNTRFVEYVAEDGNLRVYDTETDILLINSTLLSGTIIVPGYIIDVKRIDFF
jgi:hypothetical protein